MNNVTVVALAALLGAILLLIVAGMLWQEARRRPSAEPAEFVIEAAADHVHALLLASGDQLARAEILVTIEWHMQWVTQQVRAGEAGVIGESPEATHYILERQPDLTRSDVEKILRGVASYVASIGAVGPAF